MWDRVQLKNAEIWRLDREKCTWRRVEKSATNTEKEKKEDRYDLEALSFTFEQPSKSISEQTF